MADDPIGLAYEAVQKNLASQDATLSNLRNRASGLFIAATLVITFSTAVGLVNNDPSKGRPLPAWAAITSLLVVVVIGVVVMYTLWPIRGWAYGPSGQSILNYIDSGLDGNAIRRKLAEKLVASVQTNRKAVLRRGRCYQAGVLLLAIEVVVLVLPVILV